MGRIADARDHLVAKAIAEGHRGRKVKAMVRNYLLIPRGTGSRGSWCVESCVHAGGCTALQSASGLQMGDRALRCLNAALV